jgi:phosphohistidine phosphatase SixA
MHNIISSPYLRCVQTAAKICKELGQVSRIIIDYSLAEVRSPDTLGEAGRQETTRPFKDIQAYCKLHGVHCRTETMGAMPAWPESFRSAKERFAHRFLEYLQWSLKSEQNFIFVSHADCVQATLALMPSHGERGHVVSNVEFGGFFLATRETQRHSPEEADDDVYQEYHDYVELDQDGNFDSQISAPSSVLSEANVGIFSRQVSCESALSGRCEVEEDEGTISTNASDTSDRRWTVWLHNVKCKKTSKEHYERRLKTLVDAGPYDREQLTQLLGESSTRGNLQPVLGQLLDAHLVKLGSTPLGSEDNIKKLGCIASNSVLHAWFHSEITAIPKCRYELENASRRGDSWPPMSTGSQQEDHAEKMKEHLVLCREANSLPPWPPISPRRQREDHAQIMKHHLVLCQEANSLPPMLSTSREPEHAAQHIHHDVAQSALIQKRQVVLNAVPKDKFLQRRRQKPLETGSPVSGASVATI